MNAQEAALTLRKVQAYHPAQLIDDYTIDAWREAFDDIRFEDALLAVRNLGRVSSKYLDPAQIRTEIWRMHSESSGRTQSCQICSGTWEQCSRRHALEVSKGVPDPHEFESAEMVARRVSARQYGDA